MAGLEKAHVDQFEGLGFERSKVVSSRNMGLCSCANLAVQIDVLRRMNYRGANVAKINEDQVVQELLK
jgi:ubiquitin-conjugating enzyme (huntingtin interacting protein 2)